MHRFAQYLPLIVVFSLTLGLTGCGDDIEASKEALVAASAVQEPLAAPAEQPVRTLLRPDDIAAVGGIAGHRGVCTGTLVAPSWVMTTKSCVLAVTRSNLPLGERLEELYFAAPSDLAADRDALRFRTIRANTVAGVKHLLDDALHAPHLLRPHDELVLLELDRPLVTVKPLSITRNMSTSLYGQPRFITVRHSATEQERQRGMLWPRTQRAELFYQHSAHALFGGEESVQIPDLGAPLLICEAGRWVAVGALTSSDSHNDDAHLVGFWGPLNIGRSSTRARYLRIDDPTALWHLGEGRDRTLEVSRMPSPQPADEIDEAAVAPENEPGEHFEQALSPAPNFPVAEDE